MGPRLKEGKRPSARSGSGRDGQLSEENDGAGTIFREAEIAIGRPGGAICELGDAIGGLGDAIGEVGYAIGEVGYAIGEVGDAIGDLGDAIGELGDAIPWAERCERRGGRR
jgi:hypothetical protein